MIISVTLIDGLHGAMFEMDIYRGLTTEFVCCSHVVLMCANRSHVANDTLVLAFCSLVIIMRIENPRIDHWFCILYCIQWRGDVIKRMVAVDS